MKFRNPETGELFEDISDALESAYQCWDCPGIGGCPMGRKAMSYNMDCCSVAEKHAEKAARLMGYEVVEDDEPRTCFNCIGCEIEKDFDPQEGCKNWVKRKEANMDKPRICEVLGVEPEEKFNAGPYNDAYVDLLGIIRTNIGSAMDACRVCELINHPDRIIRKPRWTEQEVEDAKTFCRMWPGGEIEFKRYADGRCAMIHIQGSLHGCLDLGQVDLFPSLRPGETVKLDEIIGGAE